MLLINLRGARHACSKRFDLQLSRSRFDDRSLAVGLRHNVERADAFDLMRHLLTDQHRMFRSWGPTPDVARHARTREESSVGHAYLG